MILGGPVEAAFYCRRNPSNPATAGTPRAQPNPATPSSVSFRNCTEARAVGYSNIKRGEPDYSTRIIVTVTG